MFVSFPFFVHAQEMLQENPILGGIMGNASVDFQAKFQNLLAVGSVKQEWGRGNPQNTYSSREPGVKTAILIYTNQIIWLTRGQTTELRLEFGLADVKFYT